MSSLASCTSIPFLLTVSMALSSSSISLLDTALLRSKEIDFNITGCKLYNTFAGWKMVSLYTKQTDLLLTNTYRKGVGLRTCRIGLVNQQRNKVAEPKWHSTFLCAEHFYFHEQHLFSCVNLLLLCYRVLNMGRVAIFLRVFGHFYVFNRKFDKGHSHLTKWSFDSVEIWLFLIHFYGINFVSKVCP